MRRCSAILVLVACSAGSSARAGFFTNPTPTVTTTPMETVLHMELNGFGNYGQADGAADIAYTGESNTWTFSIPGSINLGNFRSAFFRSSLVLDDHSGVATSLYSFDIRTDGNLVYSGPAGLPHGSPVGSVFTDWVQRDYAVSGPLTSPLTFSLRNTSSAGGGDWVGIDWIELHLAPSVVPEPASVTMLCTGAFGVLGYLRRRRQQASACNA